MDPAAYDALKDFIWTRVWSGFYSSEDILADAMEGLDECWFYEDPVEADEKEVKALIDKEVAAKKADECQWPVETMCDRLTGAFEALTARGIISLECAGYTISDGWSDYQEVVVVEWEPAGARQHIRGGCFYHEQDLERAVAGDGLFLAYGATSGDDHDSIAVAGEIIQVMQEFGFKPEWDGTIAQRKIGRAS